MVIVDDICQRPLLPNFNSSYSLNTLQESFAKSIRLPIKPAYIAIIDLSTHSFVSFYFPFSILSIPSEKYPLENIVQGIPWLPQAHLDAIQLLRHPV